MEEKKYIILSTKDSFEFNLKPVLEYFRKRIKIIVGIFLAFFIIGILVAILTPEQYKSSINLLLESNASESAQRRSFLRNFDFFGSSQNMSSSPFGPEIYPDVVASTPFLMEVMNKKVYFSKYDSLLSIKDYFDKIKKPSIIDLISSYTIGLPSRIIGIFKDKNEKNNLPVSLDVRDSLNSSGSTDSAIAQSTIFKPLNISRKELSYINQLKALIAVNITNNYVNISTKMPDPMASAGLTNTVYQELSKYIIFYRTRKSTINMNFIQERTDEAKNAFYKSQTALAKFRDENRNINTSALQAEEQRLQAEFDLNFNLYKSLSQQLENAKIKVKENTPVFDVLDPVQVPIESSEPNWFKIIFIYTFLGLFIGFVFEGAKFLKYNYKYLYKAEK